ncbi:MAG: anthranilate phosphoribosyltransferase [Candidatus Micrarchaeia archaeon]
MAIVEAIAKLVERRDLTPAEAEAAMAEIMRGEASEAQIAAFLTALRMKGETVGEIAAFARVMRANCVKVATSVPTIDTCGTGGDAIKTFNVSTCAAFVLAGAGLYVAKHGNRAVTSRAGSADVLEELGVNLNLPAAAWAGVLEKVGIAFLFAPVFHPAMRHAVKPRRDIRIRTVFNVLGPITNPFGAKRQIMGVYAPELVEKMAHVLKELGCERGFVVHGMDGIDEVSIVGRTLVAEIGAGEVRKREVVPEDFGLRRASVEDILGGDAATNARIIISILKGEKGPRRDVVVANAALGLIAGGKAFELREAVAKAERAIDSGRALAKLRALVTESGGSEEKLRAAGA